jgi:peptidoglycan/LPS O-acetylase OafA/YrhL
VLVAYRPDVDGLRAVAIVSVVAFHANQAYLPGGFTGVDIFFVISGYLITRIISTELESGEFSFSNFWIRRARRLLPALLFMLVSVTLVALYLLLPDHLDQYGQLLSHAVLFVGNIFLSQGREYFDPSMQNNPLLHVWSLAVEEQYYLLWPLLLTVSLRVLSPRYFIGGFVFLFGISFAYSEWASMNLPGEAFYGLPSRAFELLIGAGLALVNARPIRSQAFANALSVSGLFLILSGMFFLDDKTRFPGIFALLPCCGAALILLGGGGNKNTLVESVLSSSIFVATGKISYSWYLWHWPPLAFARYYFERPLSPLEMTIALATGLGIAIVSWRFVETPFRRPGAHSEFQRPLLLTAIGSTAVLFLLGMSIHSLKGIPSRMDKDTVMALSQFEQGGTRPCLNILDKGIGKSECIFGNSDVTEPSLMLWGDSHALHYLPAIAKIASEQEIKGVSRIRRSCQPLVEPQEMRVTLESRSCRKANEETLAKIIAQPSISVVVLASFWSIRDILSGTADEMDVFTKNLERTIIELERHGKKIVILGQVPKIPHNLKNCLAMQVRWTRNIPGCEAFSLSQLSSYETGIWLSMQSLIQAHPDVIYFAPQNYLCNRGICRTIDEQRRPLYRDDHHLTVWGANHLEPYIGEAITQVVRSSRPPVVHTGSLEDAPGRPAFRAFSSKVDAGLRP